MVQPMWDDNAKVCSKFTMNTNMMVIVLWTPLSMQILMSVLLKIKEAVHIIALTLMVPEIAVVMKDTSWTVMAKDA